MKVVDWQIISDFQHFFPEEYILKCLLIKYFIFNQPD